MKKQDKKFSQYFYEQNFKVEKFSVVKNNQNNKNMQRESFNKSNKTK